MAHMHADRREVRFDDGRDPLWFTDVSYTPWRDGVTVFVDGVERRFDLAWALVPEREPV